MGARRPLIAGNWKMFKTVTESVAFVEAFAAMAHDGDVDAVVFPPFTALTATCAAARGTALHVGAQTMWYVDQGAFTGEISPAMIADCGASWVLLGHSERRTWCGETDEAVRRKVDAALAHGLTPIVAVGETAEEHRAGRAHERVTQQIAAAFADLDSDRVRRCVVAYEPIWAIGSGDAEEPASANDVMATIRGVRPALADVRILYGGSVKPGNIAGFIAQPNIDGALVGSASLEPLSFAQLLTNARGTVAS